MMCVEILLLLSTSKCSKYYMKHADDKRILADKVCETEGHITSSEKLIKSRRINR